MSRYLSYVHDLKNKLTLLYAISRKASQTENLSDDKVNAVIDRINEILTILSSDFDFESEGIISLLPYGQNDLDEFITFSINRMKPLYSNISIDYLKLAESWDEKIHFDKDLLYQVIENAVENSNNAQAKKVELSLLKEKQFVVIKISDNGTGLKNIVNPRLPNAQVCGINIIQSNMKRMNGEAVYGPSSSGGVSLTLRFHSHL